MVVDKKIKSFLADIKKIYEKIAIIIIINIYIQLYTVNIVKNHIYKIIRISLYMNVTLITN